MIEDKPVETAFRDDYDSISPTAFLTAFWRTLSDITYAQDISDALGAKKVAR